MHFFRINILKSSAFFDQHPGFLHTRFMGLSRNVNECNFFFSFGGIVESQ